MKLREISILYFLFFVYRALCEDIKFDPVVLELFSTKQIVDR